MNASTRTPEGWPGHCPTCGHDLCVEPSLPSLDATCPRCGSLVWLSQPRATAKPVTVKDLYKTAAFYVNRPEFRRWQENPEEPKNWEGVAAFLGILEGNEVFPAERIQEVHNAVKDAKDWCMVQEAAYLTRGAGQGGTPIHIRELIEMLDFLHALTLRFPNHLGQSI